MINLIGNNSVQSHLCFGGAMSISSTLVALVLGWIKKTLEFGMFTPDIDYILIHKY